MASATASAPVPAQGQASTSSSSIFTAPQWVKSFYSKFPLVVLEQEDELDWKARAAGAPDQSVELWIHPPTAIQPHAHYKSWASPSPSSLRTQLLFLLRDTPSRSPIPVSFRNWPNESSAPGGSLPALFIPGQERLLRTEEIRGWLEGTYPLKGKGKELQGLPSQESYDKALALSQLILGTLYPAYLASLPLRPKSLFTSTAESASDKLHLLFPNPPSLLAGLTTPLPASLTGDARDVDVDEVVRRGIEALDGIEVVLEGSMWALGAKNPTSLDALIVSHLYVLYALPDTAVLRNTLETKPVLGEYVDRVLSYAQGRL
ncbi:hypothetical protein I317_04541 [Kwoniella heveanensis CBS 569]|nr:hypothetical protein I317_04541 [Kwoniella heveanensis CBS 569]